MLLSGSKYVHIYVYMSLFLLEKVLYILLVFEVLWMREIMTTILLHFTFTSPHFTRLHFTSPRFTSPRFTSPRFTSLRFTSPLFTSPVQSSPVYEIQYAHIYKLLSRSVK